MDEKSLSGLLSQLIPGETQDETGKGDEQNGSLAEIIKATAGQSGGPGETVINEFLKGEGDLL